MRVFFRAIVVHLILNLYVFWKGWDAIPNKKYYRIPYALVFIVELLVYFLSYAFFDKLPVEYMHWGGWIGSSWMLFIIYVSVPLLLYDLVRFLNKKWKFLPTRIDLKKHTTRTGYYFVCVALVVGAMLYGRHKFRNPEVKHLRLEVEKTVPNMDSLRIVVAADIHAGFLINKPILQKYVDLIMAQNADMILLVGDLIDYDIASVEEQNMHEEFGQLKAKYGVFAVTGNHEYIDVDNEPEGKINWLRDKSGVTLLRDSVALVDSSIYIVGREDNMFVARKTAKELTSGLDKEKLIITMNHQPHSPNIHEDVASGADLAVYGHTHGGQVFPANILVKFAYELPHGYMRKEDTHVYVTSGLGLAGPQYRIGTDSEIVVIDLIFKK